MAPCRPVTLIMLAVTGLTIAACSRPAVAPKPPGFQERADALRDWEKVAGNIAKELTRAGFIPDPDLPDNASRLASNQAYYVAPRQPASPFLHEVSQSLKSEILRRGGVVARQPAGAAVIEIAVDVVRWPDRHRLPDGVGTAAGLGGGVINVLAHQGTPSAAAGFGMIAGAGIAFDILRGMNPDTNTEIAWEASITSGDHIVFNYRQPMYIGDTDAELYQPRPAPNLVQIRYTP